ncbi:hypothetical protein B0H19DRAFT_1255807 [Mycena capillaripes]|nr:hypothetical protein B0H19DRAFT_1255807 [Mycena capillaripes]
MSFTRNFDKNRHGFGKGKGKPSAPIAHAEDSQPNESIDKRRAVPALVVPSKPKPPQRSADLRYGGFRGRGRGGGRGGASVPNHNAYKPPVHGGPQSLSGRGSGSMNAGPVNSASGRIFDASRGYPIPRPFPTQQPNPYLEHIARVSELARVPNQIPASARVASPIPFLNALSSTTHAQNTPALQRVRPRPVSPAQTTPILPVASRVPDSPPPPKRRRIEQVVVKIEEPVVVLPPHPHPPSPHVGTAAPDIHSSPPSTPPIRIKLENRSPSPPPADPPRRSATSGSKRYFPVPADCTKALNPQFAANRRKWARSECAVLLDLGLKVTKFFFRDDGMVIEWTSNEPVWFDTLRSVQERPRVVVPAGQEIIDVDADDPLPSPSADDAMPPVTEEEEIPLTLEEEEEQLQQLSLAFIQRYILTFDRDRDSLANAYSEDAIFSFRDNNFACPTHFTFQRTRPSSAQSKSTMPKLPALQNYRFSPRSGMIDIDYDTVVLERELDAPTKVMLSVHGQLVGVDERTLGIDQTFVLRRDISGTGKSDAWPLVAISHQMVVRDTPWIHWTGTLDGLIRGTDFDFAGSRPVL